MRDLYNVLDEYQQISVKQGELSRKISEYFFQTFNSGINHELGVELYKRMKAIENMRFQRKGMFQSNSRQLLPLELLGRFVQDELDISGFENKQYTSLKQKYPQMSK